MKLIPTCSVVLATSISLLVAAPYMLEEQMNEQAVIGSVSERGNLRIVTYVGDLSEEGYNIPIQVEFSTDKNRVGKALPDGWLIPFFDSYVVAEDDNSLRALLPTGHEIQFKKKGESKGYINIQTQSPNGLGGGWTISDARPEIGQYKLSNRSGLAIEYSKGRITKISDQTNLVLQWRRFDKETEVYAGGHRLASLQASGEGYELDLGKNVVKLKSTYSSTSLGQSISEISINGEVHDEFSFSTGKSNNLEWTCYEIPELPRTENYSWQKDSGILLADSDFEYKILLAKNGFIDLVERTSKDGSYKESFDVDAGKFTSKTSNSNKFERQAFFMSAFTGRLRKYSLSSPDDERTTYFSYDERGDLSRIRAEKGKE